MRRLVVLAVEPRESPEHDVESSRPSRGAERCERDRRCAPSGSTSDSRPSWANRATTVATIGFVNHPTPKRLAVVTSASVVASATPHRRGPDTAELVDDVEPAGQLHPRRVELEVLPRPRALLPVGNVWAGRSRDASPLLRGRGPAGEAVTCDLRDLGSGDAFEPHDEPRDVEARVA